MLRTRLLTATAAVALFAAGSALAQTAPMTPPAQDAMPAQAPATAPQTAPAPAPAAAPVAAAQPAPAATPAAQNTIVDVLRTNGQFTTLLSALDAAQLTDTLRTQPAVSIFAPTDAAFAALSDAERTRLLAPANVNELRQLLLYHVVVADVNSSQIEGAKGGVQTAANTEVQLDGTGSSIKVDNATVTTADIDAGNGSIFIIDRVLNPANSLVASGDAEEAAAPAADEATTAPVPDEVEATPPVVDEDMDEATPPASSATDAALPPVPAAPAPSSAAPMAAPTAPMTSTRPATGERAPNGQPAATTTTVASPPVPNPTDGQVDDEDDADAPAPAPTPAPTPAPRPQS